MKKVFLFSIIILSNINFVLAQNSLSAEHIDYWYAGEAEINSYTLQQARYGELREGTTALIFVTEPFSEKSMSKADYPANDDVSVLKLNFTKNFNTGIYPYSMMTSTFLPVDDSKYSLKISSSSQEWCGHTYMELENRDKLEIGVSSYFQNETEYVELDKTYLEDDFWSLIRLNPSTLPVGEMEVIPSFFYLRLAHIETKAYPCILKNEKVNNEDSYYSIEFPSLERSLVIYYETQFPHKILSWEETLNSGFGANKKPLKTIGTLMKSIKSDYWNKNSNSNLPLRKELGLE